MTSNADWGCYTELDWLCKNVEPIIFRIVAIETPGGKRNLNININAQQAILKAYISKQFK